MCLWQSTRASCCCLVDSCRILRCAWPWAPSRPPSSSRSGPRTCRGEFLSSCSAAWRKSTLDIPTIHAGQKEVRHRHAEQVGRCTWCQPLAPWIWLPAGGISRATGGRVEQLGLGGRGAHARCRPSVIAHPRLARARSGRRSCRRGRCCCCPGLRLIIRSTGDACRLQDGGWWE